MAQATLDAGHGHQLSTADKAKNENMKLAMWLYLASEVVIFSILIAGYAIYRVTNPDSVKLVHEGLGIALVTFNTFILLASSYAMVMGLRALELGKRTQFYQWIGLTALMGTVFLVLQWVEYAELAHLEIALQGAATTANSELFAGMNVTPEQVESMGNFGMRFYAPTAFHGAHVLIGVIWALGVLWHGLRGGYQTNSIGVELFGLYWHFVDVVWIVLFTLIYLV